jgi:hypothetical protein
VGARPNCPVLLLSQPASATVDTMISQRPSAVSRAQIGARAAPRLDRTQRWPLLWTLSGAVVVSLALWAGIFVIADAVIELVRGF